MNVNEVLANRANELLGGARGTYRPVHPNDHVNMAQSTNDVIPTAMRLAALATLPALLARCDGSGRGVPRQGPRRSTHIVKSGRTHLQDATPIRLGQEFPPTGARWPATAPSWRRRPDWLRGHEHRRHRRGHRPQRRAGVSGA